MPNEGRPTKKNNGGASILVTYGAFNTHWGNFSIAPNPRQAEQAVPKYFQ
jgi:hypothetical protein